MGKKNVPTVAFNLNTLLSYVHSSSLLHVVAANPQSVSKTLASVSFAHVSLCGFPSPSYVPYPRGTWPFLSHGGDP